MAGTILTSIGLSKLAAATPQNQLNITHIAVGDGNGGFPTLSPNATALTNEVWRGDASNPIKDGSNSNYVYFETNIPPEVGPFDVREIACFDIDGDMIAIGHTSLIQKPNPTDDASFALAVKIFIALENASDFDLIYQNTEVTSHNSLADRNAVGAHDQIYRRESTIQELNSGIFNVGSKIVIPSRNYAKFDIKPGVSNGLDKIDAGNGKIAELVIDEKTSVDSFGASALSSDNHPSIQRMVDVMGYFKLNAANYNIQDEILFNGSVNSYGSKWSGEGKEKSFIICSNMNGKSAIRYTTGGLCRVSFQDFKIDGDCQTCLSFPDTTLVYQSTFERLWLNSVGVCFKIDRPFSTTIRNVELGSETNHAIESFGGNTFKLDTVYAHKVGEGCAGFRIYGKATLDNCNGIDETEGNKYWGWFGNSASGNSYNVTLRNCNAEDFGTDGAIKTEHFGSLSIYASSFLPRHSGTFDNIIQMATSGNNKIYIDLNTTVASKGATLSGNSYIKAGDLKSGVSFSPNFIDFSIGSNVYNMPSIAMNYPSFGRTALTIDSLYSENDYSFARPRVKTIPSGAITVETNGFGTLQTSNSSATTLQTITPVIDGARVALLIKDNNTTIANNTGGTGRIILRSGVDDIKSSGDVIMLVGNSGRWAEQ